MVAGAYTGRVGTLIAKSGEHCTIKRPTRASNGRGGDVAGWATVYSGLCMIQMADMKLGREGTGGVREVAQSDATFYVIGGPDVRAQDVITRSSDLSEWEVVGHQGQGSQAVALAISARRTKAA